jgi:hypothetical protein
MVVTWDQMTSTYKITVGKLQMNTLGVDERIILKRMLEKLRYEGMNRIQGAQDRVQCRVLVNTVMNLRVAPKQGISWTAE